MDRSVKVTQGFAEGIIVIEAFVATDPNRTRYQIDIQNEFICCFRLASDGQRSLVVCAPHLITVVDSETGFPITTEELRPGQRVAVVAIRAPPQLLTPQALPVVGPQYFMPEEKYGQAFDLVFPE